ncbi:hypothetical protein ACROYT_G009306 [Oculina patagonica]
MDINSKIKSAKHFSLEDLALLGKHSDNLKLDFREFKMVDAKKQASFLVIFVLCTLMASEVVFGHFTLGREVKLPVREGPINSLQMRNFERQSHLRKNQLRTGEQTARTYKQNGYE